MGAKPGACACEVRAMGVTLRFARARGDRGVIPPAPDSAGGSWLFQRIPDLSSTPTLAESPATLG